MRTSILNEFRLTVAEEHLYPYGISIYQKGQGSLFHQWRSDDAICLYSGSKTFTSLGIGICQDERRLRLEDKVLDFFPEYRGSASEGTADITLRDLLHMASGKETFWCSPQSVMEEADWAGEFLKQPVSHKPGEYFFYSNACTYLLGRVVEKVSGQILRDYLVPRLFTPLGIFNPQWHTCPGGHTLAATGLYLHNQEYHRLGIAMLQNGVYEDYQIVSADYIHHLHTDLLQNKHHSPDPESSSGYGYQVWKCSSGQLYRADGMYGQFSIVIPELDAVVTITSHQEQSANNILRAIYRDIIPHLESA